MLPPLLTVRNDIASAAALLPMHATTTLANNLHMIMQTVFRLSSEFASPIHCENK